MIIRSLRMESFLSHSETSIDFDSGVNIIVGKNGAGKSSIFEAIKFALFGMQRSNRDLLQYGKKHGKVKLTFNLEGSEYYVERTLERSGSRIDTRGAVISSGDRVLAEGVTAVNQVISRIIGVSDEVFMNSVFIEQGQIDSLITKQKSKRLDLFNEILGLHNLQKVFDRLNEMKKGIESDIKGLEPVEVLYNSEKLRANEITQTIENLKMKEREENEKLEIIKNSMEQLEKQQIESNNQREKKAALEAEITSLNKSITEIKKTIDDLTKEIEVDAEDEKRLRTLEEDKRYKFRAIIQKYFQNGQQIDQIKHELQELSRSIEMTKARKDQMEVIKPYFEEYEIITKDTSIQTSWVKENRQRFLEISGNRALLKNREKDHLELSKRLNEFLETLKQKLSIDDPDLAKINDIKRFTEVELERISQEKAIAQSQIKSSRDKIAEINENILLLRDGNQCPVCRQDLSETHRKEIMDQYESEKIGLLNNIESLERLIRAVDIKIPKLKNQLDFINGNVLGEFNSLKKRENELRENIDKLTKEISNNTDFESEYKKAELSIEAATKRLKEIESQWNEYKRLKAVNDSVNLPEIEKKQTDQLQALSKLEMENKGIEKESGFIPVISYLEEAKSMERNIDILRKKVGGTDLKRKILKDKKDNLSKTVAEIEEKSTEMSKIVEKLESLKAVEKNLESKKNETDALNKLIIVLKQKIASGNEELQRLDNHLKELQANISLLNSMRNAYIVMGKLIPAFRRDGLPRLIRVRSSQFITDMTTELMTHFNLSVEGVKVTEDLDIEVYQNGSVKELQQLSGGERTAVAIALRMAMAKYLLSSISVMLMDEPTNFLDEERRNDLKEIITYSLRDEGIIPQLIVITHHSELNSAADISYTVESKNGISQIIPT